MILYIYYIILLSYKYIILCIIIYILYSIIIQNIILYYILLYFILFLFISYYIIFYIIIFYFTLFYYIYRGCVAARICLKSCMGMCHWEMVWYRHQCDTSKPKFPMWKSDNGDDHMFFWCFWQAESSCTSMYCSIWLWVLYIYRHRRISPPPPSYRDSLVNLSTTMGSLTALDLDMMKFAGRLWMYWGPKDVLGMMDPAPKPPSIDFQRHPVN